MSHATLTALSGVAIDERHAKPRGVPVRRHRGRVLRAPFRLLLRLFMTLAWMILFLLPVGAFLLTWWLGLA